VDEAQEVKRYFPPFFLIPLLLVGGNAFSQHADSSAGLRAADLVELVRLDSTFRLDIRYATPRNFLGRPVYAQPRAFLRRPAAEALLRVHRWLRRQGYGLVIFDGYRPWAVTKLFWDETPPDKRKYVANPSKGSVHNRGCAVDLTLYDRHTGEEVVMPSAYDAFVPSASASYRGGTQRERRMRDLLIRAMRRVGFTVNPDEWWHFNFRGWRNYPVLDIPFEQLAPRPAIGD
jgi:D-alanyl-D-alanine dipeptidase